MKRNLREDELGRALQKVRELYVKRSPEYPAALCALYAVGKKLRIRALYQLKWDIRNARLPEWLESVKDGEIRVFEDDVTKTAASLAMAAISYFEDEGSIKRTISRFKRKAAYAVVRDLIRRNKGPASAAAWMLIFDPDFFEKYLVFAEEGELDSPVFSILQLLIERDIRREALKLVGDAR